jgi:hypothetical protein
MRLGSALATGFDTKKPSTGIPMNSTGVPVSVVYRNGVAIAPAAPPVVANLAVGLYSLTYGLTVANGHALNDWVGITEQVTLDGYSITRGAWEGSLCQDPEDQRLVLGNTIYPILTTHWPETGANVAPDGGVAPVITVYRNMVATAIVPVLLNPAVGVYLITLPLTAGAGWAVDDRVDILATATIDGLAAMGWAFTGGLIAILGNSPAAEIIRGAYKRGNGT